MTQIFIANGLPDGEIDLEVTYTFTPATGRIIEEIVFTDDQWDGNRYEQTLPPGVVDFDPPFRMFSVKPIEPKSLLRPMHLSKTGGRIVTRGNLEFETEEAFVVGAPHPLAIHLDSTEVCIGRRRLSITEGVSLTLANVPFNYGSDDATLSIGPAGRVVIAEGTTEEFGNDGIGRHEFLNGGVLKVAEDAELILKCQLQVPSRDTGYMTLERGSQLTISNEATPLFRSHGCILVSVAPGARIDSSAASLETMAMFKFSTVSTTRDRLPDDAFDLVPNPTFSGEVELRTTVEVKSVEVVDLYGRVFTWPGEQLDAQRKSI